jgi:hypothetical protein
MVAEVGLEPTRSCLRQILSLLCLPISPLGHKKIVPQYAEPVRPRSVASTAQPASGGRKQPETGAGRNRAGFSLPRDERARKW